VAGISFREVVPEDGAMILGWRRQRRVADYMTGEVVDDLEAQHRWLASCRTKPDYYHWIVQIAGAPAGLISLADYDAAQASASWGFYIGDEKQLGFGGFVPPHFYNWAFSRLGLQALHANVFADNRAVIELHRLHGYRFDPAADRVIQKADRQVQLVALELTPSLWNKRRWTRFDAAFPTTLWQARPAALQAVAPHDGAAALS
jgi:RimJ/RimL family protein N-acetyltransferase